MNDLQDRCTICGRFMSIWEDWGYMDDPNWNSYSFDPPEQLPAHPKCLKTDKQVKEGTS